MIRENSLLCKLIRIKTSSKALFDSFMDGFCPGLQTCPCCGAKGNCRIHAYYGRSLVDFIGGAPVRHSLCIMRLIYTCGHTHAILPDFIIFGRIMHSQMALRSRWDKGWKNNSQFASPSIRRPTMLLLNRVAGITGIFTTREARFYFVLLVGATIRSGANLPGN